ncbi:MAG: hypothetical protein HY822_18525, partial [Acidobacteria bacterium]|nr:hypothetical protein [Acidobacteriota bacterium]
MTAQSLVDFGPRLLPDWSEQRRPGRTLGSGAASVLLHLAVVALAASLPGDFWRGPPRAPVREARRVTPLVAPPFEITQKEPNRGKIAKEIDYQSLLPRPPLTVPSSPRSAPGPGLRVP